MAATTVAEPSLASPILAEKPHYEIVKGERRETPRMGSYESQLANDIESLFATEEEPE